MRGVCTLKSFELANNPQKSKINGNSDLFRNLQSTNSEGFRK